jgi:uncharacterized membrane protein YiaA
MKDDKMKEYIEIVFIAILIAIGVIVGGSFILALLVCATPIIVVLLVVSLFSNKKIFKITVNKKGE